MEYEKFPLHTITKVEERPILVKCADKSDWEGYKTVNKRRGYEKNIEDSKDAILVLDDMDSKLNIQMNTFFTSGRHHNIQMIVICHKPAQMIRVA